MAAAASIRLTTYRPHRASPGEFVDFWSALYEDPREDLYAKSIKRPLTPKRVGPLFIWKNGGKLSKPKQRSVEHNFIARLDELHDLPKDTPAETFLARFATGGVIWRIFWLHCWQPDRFPIYDQHVHRAMMLIEDREPDELSAKDDRRKIRLYLDRYLTFHRRFAGSDQRSVDRALWAFGKFIKAWRLGPWTD